MQKIHSEIRRVDAGILAAVRQQVVIFAIFSCWAELTTAISRFLVFDWLVGVVFQSNSGTKAKEDLAAATCAVEVGS